MTKSVEKMFAAYSPSQARSLWDVRRLQPVPSKVVVG